MKKSLALTMIIKDEVKNLPRLFESIKGCFNKIYITDTGSTDGTIELLEQYKEKNPAETPLEVLHFEWIKDFAAARNHALQFIKEDYITWIDGDDLMDNRESFIKWRDSVMYMADLWIATYDYAQDNQGRSVCSFARERVWKNGNGLKFSYFTHEGLMVNSPGIKVQHVPSWSIKHQRTIEDINKDKGRNHGILKYHEENGTKFDARMEYYFGKEYFEGGDIENALKMFAKAISSTELEMHDRILCMQYFCMCLFQKEKFVECIDIAKQGLSLSPTRAEFYVLQGDCYTKLQRILEAIPCYAAASSCRVQTLQNGAPSVIFSHQNAYGPYPLCQLARCFVHIQNFGDAQKYAAEANDKYPSPETKALLDEITNIKGKVLSFRFAKECDDIVFTCLGNMYEWDDVVHSQKGCGGSETATIFMAKHLKKITKRRVIVFNSRKEDYISQDGVEYRKLDSMQSYFSMNKPYVHFSWRHNIKLTDARTYIISHDIFTPGCERLEDYEKYVCLSEFHKNYISTIHMVPEDKIIISRNGIIPEIFGDVPKVVKNPYKIIYSSSPDRGLLQAINVMDLARMEMPELELHVYYGMDNMKKSGGPMAELASKLEGMMSERPWIKYHGGTAQKDLPKHYADASILLFPTNFIETFMITALEVLACGVFPICRSFGAITSTLGPYADKGMAKLMGFDAQTVAEQLEWSETLKSAIKAKAWEKVQFSVEDNSWESVAKDYIREFNL